MDLDTVRRVARDLARVKTDMVELSGKGDPIAHPELTEIVKALKDADLTVALVTNGTLAKPDLARTLVERGLDRLTVSLNAGCRETYLATSNCDLWDKAVAFLEEIKTKKQAAGADRPWVRFSHVVTKENIDDMDGMAQVCADFGANEVDFCVLGELPETTHLQLDEDDIAVIRAGIDRWSTILRSANVVFDLQRFLANLETRVRHGESQHNPLQKKVPCYIGYNFAVIGPDGVVAPCCYCEETVLGNVNEESFVDIWHGSRYTQFRKNSMGIPKSGRWICKECFTTCNRAIEHCHIYNKLHPFNPVSLSE